MSLGESPWESEIAPHFCLLGRISAQHRDPPAGTSVAWPAEAQDAPIRGVVVALHLQNTNSFSSGTIPKGGSKNSRFSPIE